MTRIRQHLIILILVLSSVSVAAQNFSNRGKEFWVGYGHTVQMEDLPLPIESQEMVLYFSAEEAAHVTVTIKGTSYKEEYDVPANSVITSKIIPRGKYGPPPTSVDARLWSPDVTLGGTNSQGLFNRHGIHIVSTVPIVAYAHIYLSNSSAATMLMPVESWGYAYSVLAPRMATNYGYAPGSKLSAYSWMYVVAKEDDTKIRITPSAPIRSGQAPGVPFDVTLQKGDIYQIMADKTGYPLFQYDLGGTTVRSIANSKGECLPIATFMGSSSQFIFCRGGLPSNGTYFPEDILFQQIFPEHAWGRRYATIPTCVDADPMRHNVNFYLVKVNDPATVVKRNGVIIPSASLLQGNYYEFSSNTADYIEADQPILVAQMQPSEGACGYLGRGDPDFVFLSPIEQGIKHTGFYRTNKVTVAWNYLLLNIPTEGLKSLKIDGQQNFSNVYPNPNLPGYSVVVQQWRTTLAPRAPAQAIVESDSAFTAMTYGFGVSESYMYNAGAYINNLSGYPFIKNQYNTADTANKYTCVNTPVELSVLVRYEPTKIQWKLSKLAGTIEPAVDVVDNAPVSKGMQMVNGVPYYRYTLPGYYKFKQAGKFTIPVFTTHPSVKTCDNTEEIFYEVEVKGELKSDFTIDYQNCKTSELIKFNGEDNFKDTTPIRRWEWSFLNGTTPSSASGKNVQQTFNAGSHSARLIAIDANACVADTTKLFTLSANPVTPAFDALPALICEGSTISFSEKAPEGGVKKWYWDFGAKDTVTLTTGGTPTRTFSKPGTITVKHMVKFSDVCYSDTAVQQVVVYARPDLSIQYPAGCLPTDGNVQFTSTSKAPDGQALSSYSWNFGDATANASNPNTSTLANPTHKYTNYGTYDITYKVTTEKGCYRDTVIKATFNVRPQFTFGALSAICENSAPISVAKATVTNGVPGTGIYKGKGVSGIGQFDPATAGAGNQTIWYVFTTTQGCTDSVSQTINVLPKPRAAFTATNQICLDGAVTITDQSTIPTGTISSWNWNYGNGVSEVRNAAAAFNKQYSQAGTYTIQLVAIGNNGCSSDTTKHVVTVNPLPTVNFELPSMVCMPTGKAQFTNGSTISTNSELSYAWNFGDNSSSNEASPLHIYTRAGTYTVSLKTTSAEGCSATASKTLNKFYNQPVAAFAVSANELCQGNASVFSDQSTSSNGAVATWQWAFGDGTNNSISNPSKTYSQPGTYTVQLVVKDGVGCTSEPVSKTVQVYLQPVIDAGPNFTVKEGTTIQFKATANSSNLLFVWTPGQELSNANILQPSLLVNNDGVYKLTATGDHNCTATDELKVVVQRPVEAPNVFSPNGDGINDTWVIKNLGLYPNSLLEVFNRYGQKVFSTKGNAKLWDGKMNGQPVPIGTYYYVIELGNGDPALKGSVTVLR
ncbi:PKD domain-containing protein [Flavisolibacter tropicus]|uniref:PKD domain-containing protein n=1 Tax=Flavisolibacter tropicus TaxID=1492898 RepID=A0A172U1U0_9BACT|nr:PKD domain-containing protein [Flavisolibacter tropicus]ANE53182.1 hypothetical protein SY85_24665 [Flavisolibacter tropicus]